MRPPHKFELYERAVQSPKTHIDWVVSTYREIHGRYARHLREDFCGTFLLSCEWVKRNKRNTAVCLDLDPETLSYGRKAHYAKLTRAQKKRIMVLRRNVVSVTPVKADILVAGNFSFYVFKERELLVNYLRCCLKSLRKGGMVILEMAGGPGMIETVRERRTARDGKGRKFTYIWDQQSFNPINHHARYAIHFKLQGGRELRSAFAYDWRLWTLPEVREAALEAGFGQTFVYWETEHQGKGTGEYVRTEEGDNAYAWLAYFVAIKK